MHVVMLSDFETLGGAAVAASRLAEGLCHDHQVTRCVLQPDGQDQPWRTRPLPRAEPGGRWQKLVERTLPGSANRRRQHQTATHLRRALEQLRPDVINVHNLHGGASEGWCAEMAGLCLEYAPVVWTLHDMWSFTGRCAYSYDCRKFETGCDAACPTPKEYPTLQPLEIRPAWEARRRLFARRGDLVAATPSSWLAREARCGSWKGHRVEVIPYGLPTDLYRPLDRAEARRLLGIAGPGPVVLVVAHYLHDRRKGGEVLKTVWSHVRHRPLTLLTVGLGSVPPPGPGVTLCELGWVGEVQRQALAYSAADVLLHPAPVDNFPNVILEAQSCGTPAVGLPVGGVPEMVLPGQTGWLASAVSPEALGEALEEALDDIQGGVSLRGPCRAVAEQDFALPVQAGRYATLFRALVAERNARKAG
jgi:glycosyltransferase involved in cell wall biosynthesis